MKRSKFSLFSTLIAFLVILPVCKLEIKPQAQSHTLSLLVTVLFLCVFVVELAFLPRHPNTGAD